jgi:hypothetical protein
MEGSPGTAGPRHAALSAFNYLIPRIGFNNATTNVLAALVLIETAARAVAFRQLDW